ncbi:MAG: ABC transporter permease [Betaproteobacteria bacterium]|nr:ABC transporter permease [Betaproteobacteria bacterium]
MTLRLAFAYLASRPLATILHVLMLALGVATLAFLLLFTSQAEERLARDAKPVDLVVGAKGSPLQLILSSVFHVDIPTGNIGLEESKAISRHPMVASATPVALGDSYRGHRIVGTDASFLGLYDAKVAAGRPFKEEMEVVVGSEVARRHQLAPGAKIVGSHGLAQTGPGHDEDPFEVVGVLAPTGTVIDRLVLTPVESVWHVHEHHGDAPAKTVPEAPGKKHKHDHDDDEPAKAPPAGPAPGAVPPGMPPALMAASQGGRLEITALLVKYRTPLAAAMLPRLVNSSTSMQAASPAYESARLLDMVGVGVQTLQWFAAIMMASAALSVFVALTSALQERRYDLALLRTLGARPLRLASLTLAEGVTLLVSGVILGLALGHGAAHALGLWLAQSGSWPLAGLAWAPGETILVAAVFAGGFATCLVPAVQAYLSDPASLLAKR